MFGKKVEWGRMDTAIQHEGSKITLPAQPEKMPLDEAISALVRKRDDENRETMAVEHIEGYIFDALVALNRAMRDIYGWASPVPTPGFFGDTPPVMVTIKTGPDPKEALQVPWGSFKIPGVSAAIKTSASLYEGRYCLTISGKVRMKETPEIARLAARARELLREQSIYRGKAFTLPRGHNGLDFDRQPSFMATGHVKRENVVFSKNTEHDITVSLFTPLERRRECEAQGVPFSRKVLLEGTYGTGKSLTAALTALLSTQNGITFIYVEAENLAEALRFARQYEPAVVFAEDIDRVVQSRAAGTGHDIVNEIDGILSKDSQVMVVLTSNFPEKLDKAMLRPGRLDAIITVESPDAEAVARLIRLYGGDLIAKDEDLTEVGAFLQGNIPATIAEVVKRSKLAMVARGGTNVTGDDLLVTARCSSVKRQLDLLAKEKPAETPETRFGKAMVEIVKQGQGDSEVAPVARSLDAIVRAFREMGYDV